MCEHGGTELLIVELFEPNRLFDIPIDRSKLHGPGKSLSA